MSRSWPGHLDRFQQRRAIAHALSEQWKDEHGVVHTPPPFLPTPMHLRFETSHARVFDREVVRRALSKYPQAVAPAAQPRAMARRRGSHELAA